MKKKIIIYEKVYLHILPKILQLCNEDCHNSDSFSLLM